MKMEIFQRVVYIFSQRVVLYTEEPLTAVDFDFDFELTYQFLYLPLFHKVFSSPAKISWSLEFNLYVCLPT